MADDSGIDPRYAAQFQRGFDPAQHEAPPAPRGPVRLAGGPPPTAQRVPDPPRIPVTAAEAPRDGAEPPLVEAPLPLLTRWDWLLPVLGGALMVLAATMWWSYGTDYETYFGTGENDGWPVFWQQLRYVLPGPLLTAGAFAVTGGIVLQALRPRA